MSDQTWVRRIFEQGRYTVIGLVVALLVSLLARVLLPWQE